MFLFSTQISEREKDFNTKLTALQDKFTLLNASLLEQVRIQILSTSSVRKCIEFSQENSYVDIGAGKITNTITL